jgi:hypothetical protein
MPYIIFLSLSLLIVIASYPQLLGVKKMQFWKKYGDLWALYYVGQLHREVAVRLYGKLDTSHDAKSWPCLPSEYAGFDIVERDGFKYLTPGMFLIDASSCVAGFSLYETIALPTSQWAWISSPRPPATAIPRSPEVTSVRSEAIRASHHRDFDNNNTASPVPPNPVPPGPLTFTQTTQHDSEYAGLLIPGGFAAGGSIHSPINTSYVMTPNQSGDNTPTTSMHAYNPIRI